MSVRVKIFAIGAALCGLCTSVSAMSLGEAVSRAVRTNPDIKAAQASRRATDHVRNQAAGRFLPEVDLNGDIGFQRIDRPEGFGPLVNNRWRNRRGVSVSVRQVLFDGWDRINDYYSSQARISAASHKVLARSENVALRVVEAYIDVLRHQKLLRLARDNVSRHRALLKLVQARVSGGASSSGDLEQTKERMQAALALVAQIKIARETSKAKFKRVVGVGPRKLRTVKSARHSYKSSARAARFAIANNPRLKAISAEIDVAEFRKKQFGSALLPQIYLEGSASRGEDLEGTPGRSDELKGMVVLSWKLYDGGIRQSRISELHEREYEKIAEHDSLVRQIREAVEIAWARVVEGGHQVSAVRKQLNQNRRVVKSYRAEYEADKRSLLDVLDAENSRFASEFELSNVRAIQKFSGYQIIAHAGQLLKRFGVKKPKGSRDNPMPVKRAVRASFKRSFKIPSLSGN